MNTIHPTAQLDPRVELGDGNVIGAFAVIQGPVRIGDGNWIGPHAVIGTPGEMRGGAHPAEWPTDTPAGFVTIGDDNVLRELITVQAPAFGRTTIGDRTYVMNHVHVAHDVEVADDATLSSHCVLGGHVAVGPRANVGLQATVHQRLVIGPGAIVGMGSVVTRPVPPFAKFYGSPARQHGLNDIGLDRAELPDASREALRAALTQGDDLSALALDGRARDLIEWWTSRSGPSGPGPTG